MAGTKGLSGERVFKGRGRKAVMLSIWRWKKEERDALRFNKDKRKQKQKKLDSRG